MHKEITSEVSFALPKTKIPSILGSGSSDLIFGVSIHTLSDFLLISTKWL
jgi:hypothetical protein